MFFILHLILYGIVKAKINEVYEHFLKEVLAQTILRDKKVNQKKKHFSDYQLAKAYRILLILIKRTGKRFFS